jgi:excisionase family DNA binding protein
MIKRLPTKRALLVDPPSSGSSRLSDSDIVKIADGVARRLEGMPSTPPRAMVSIKEACSLLGIAKTTIYKLIKQREIETRHIGRRTLIPMSQIQAILDGGLSR